MLRALVWRWSRYGCPVQGIGIGLRRDLAEELTQTSRQLDLIEVMPENWICFGGKRQRQMLSLPGSLSAVTHSIALNIGGLDPLDNRLLDGIASFCERHDVPFWSDHVCYSTVLGTPTFDLLPLPFTRQIIAHTARASGRRRPRRATLLLLENATFYAQMPPPPGTPPADVLDEATFLCELLEAGDCSMLLDVNNVYVSSRNHGFDPQAFIDRMPLSRVRQIHLAGHSDLGNVIIDTHIGPIIDPVWDLYAYTLQRAGRLIPTIIEWDAEIPPLDQVIDEADRARAVAERDATSAEPAGQAGESPLARAS